MTNLASPAQYRPMDSNRAAVVAFYKEAMRVTGLSPAPLAVKSDLAHTTISKFLNNPLKHNIPTLPTLKKVANFANIPLPQFSGAAARTRTPAAMPEEDLIRLIRGLVGEAVRWDREMNGEMDPEVLLEGAEAVVKEHLHSQSPGSLGDALVKVMARRQKAR